VFIDPPWQLLGVLTAQLQRHHALRQRRPVRIPDTPSLLVNSSPQPRST